MPTPRSGSSRSCDLEGVNAEAPSLEELLKKLPGVILDLLEEAGFG